MTNPSAVVGVLSTTTEAYDRGETFAHYRHIPPLRDDILDSQTAPAVEVWTRRGPAPA